MKGVLIDANLLCLLAVGRVDPASIRAHPRLGAFDVDDLVLLDAALQRLGDPVLCPHVLTETSNLLGYRQGQAREARWRASLGALVRMSEERSMVAVRAIEDQAFRRLGLTDAVLMLLASDNGLALISDDLALCLEAARRGVRSINYNHLREGALRVEQL